MGHYPALNRTFAKAGIKSLLFSCTGFVLLLLLFCFLVFWFFGLSGLAAITALTNTELLLNVSPYHLILISVIIFSLSVLVAHFPIPKLLVAHLK